MTAISCVDINKENIHIAGDSIANHELEMVSFL